MLGTFNLLKNWASRTEGHYTLSGEDLRSVQRVLLMMMDDIHDLCVRERIEYVMTGGCAIGAVRHGGFIPWDDDIDVCMPRADYDRFADIVEKSFPGKYEVQEIRRDKGHGLNFMKLRLRGTKFREASEADRDEAGVFIDIFPIENVYDNAVSQLWQGIRSDGLQFICSCVRLSQMKDGLKVFADASGRLPAVLRFKLALGRIFGFMSLRSWLLLTERALSCCGDNASKRVAIPTGRGHFKGERYPRKWFFKPVLREFEGREYFFPARIKLYLSRLYGDYMKIPPREQRESHSVLEFDLGEYRNL